MRWFFQNISWNSDTYKKKEKSSICFLAYIFVFFPCPKISLHLFELVVQQLISLFFTQGLLYTSIDKDKSKVHNTLLFLLFCYFFFMLDYGFIVLRSSMYSPKSLEWIVMGRSTTFVLNKGELHEGWWFLLCHDMICILFTISTTWYSHFWFEVEKTMLYLNLQCQEVILVLNELTIMLIARHNMKCMAIKRMQMFICNILWIFVNPQKVFTKGNACLPSI
jgi:hypothetical protein